jgi:ribosomal protein S27E
MTSEVIELNDRRPHTAKRVVCMNCVNTWVAVFPSNTTGLECSECGAMEGEPFQSNNFEWVRRLADDLIVAEAKLAKAVDALEAGVICTTKHGGAAEFLRIARTTLAELKGQDDE